MASPYERSESEPAQISRTEVRDVKPIILKVKPRRKRGPRRGPEPGILSNPPRLLNRRERRELALLVRRPARRQAGRGQEVGALLPRRLESFPEAPAEDLGVVPREQHLGHREPLDHRRAG